MGAEAPNGVSETVRRFGEEASLLLPSLSGDISFDLDVSPSSPMLVPDYGVGGFAVARDRVIIAFDPTADVEPGEHLMRLRGAVFHETFHLAQGFTADCVSPGSLSALHDAVMEGAATVFERERAGSDPPWGRYLDEETMLALATELAALPLGYDQERWKFWDAATARPWIIYRTGTFLVDRALARSAGVVIEDLAARDADEILAMAAAL